VRANGRAGHALSDGAGGASLAAGEWRHREVNMARSGERRNIHADDEAGADNSGIDASTRCFTERERPGSVWALSADVPPSTRVAPMARRLAGVESEAPQLKVARICALVKSKGC
jgi:hypothetical protein